MIHRSPGWILCGSAFVVLGAVGIITPSEPMARVVCGFCVLCGLHILNNELRLPK